MYALLKKFIPFLSNHNLRKLAKRIRYFGRRRYCPVCNSYASAFQPFGLIPREEAKCPFCGSLERHRLIWVFFQRKTNLFNSPLKKMLHIAPEPMFAKIFSNTDSINYISGDLLNPDAMVIMDVTDIKYPDNSFDVIYCSHVLEHVLDDRKAMREFWRVLKPSGWAVLQVPITAANTHEDSSITDPVERERVFGQWDHVRRYGPDYKERLVEAGFVVEQIEASQIVSERELERLRINRSEDVFYCTKS